MTEYPSLLLFRSLELSNVLMVMFLEAKNSESAFGFVPTVGEGKHRTNQQRLLYPKGTLMYLSAFLGGHTDVDQAYQ
jgi:hypothetical protein